MIKVFSSQMRELIETEVQVQRLASGFEFTEGPIWHPRDRHLRFSDVPGNRRLQYSLDGTTQEVRNPSSKCNGKRKATERENWHGGNFNTGIGAEPLNLFTMNDVPRVWHVFPNMFRPISPFAAPQTLFA